MPRGAFTSTPFSLKTRLAAGHRQRSPPEVRRGSLGTSPRGPALGCLLREKNAVIGRVPRHLGLPAEIPAPRPTRAPPVLEHGKNAADWGDPAVFNLVFITGRVAPTCRRCAGSVVRCGRLTQSDPSVSSTQSVGIRIWRFL